MNNSEFRRKRNGGSKGSKGSKRRKQPETRSTVTGMSSFFEFLIKAILCMQVKNFMTVYLMARGLQLTLFRFGINAQDARYKDTCFYWKKEGVVQAMVPFLSHEWQSCLDARAPAFFFFFFNLKRDRKLNLYGEIEKVRTFLQKYKFCWFCWNFR